MDAAASVGTAPTVLTTKLSPPRGRSAAPPRARLVDGCATGSDRVLLVVAPAGFGKSTLLAHWAARENRHVGWLSLDERDNSPVRFWLHVIASLHGVVPEFTGRAMAALRSPRAPVLAPLLEELVNALAGGGPIALVLDDYHVIEHPELHAGVAFLIDHLPPGATVAIARRSSPPLPLARLRGRGEIVEIGPADLRATHAEARSFLIDGMGLALGEEAIERLVARTEGWFAGLQLAALALRGREQDAGAIDAFGAKHRLVLEYLTEEVLAGLDDDLRSFMLDASFLARMTPDACDAVLGRSDSEAMLARLDAANLFVVALDGTGSVYRFHALFAELLQREAHARDPARTRTLHSRAGAYFRAHGDTDEAIRHLLAADDPNTAIDVVAEAAVPALQAGRVAELVQWLEDLPAGSTAERPRLSVARAWAYLVAGDPRGIPDLLDTADVALQAGTPDPDVAREVAALRAHVAAIRGDTEEAIRIAEAALGDGARHSSWLRGNLLISLGSAHHRAGDLDAAGAAFEGAAATFSPTAERYGWLHAVQGLGDTKRLQGDLDAAERAYRSMLEAPPGTAGTPTPVLGLASIGLGKISSERFELDDALSHVEQGIAMSGTFERGVWIDGLLTLALIQRLRGGFEEADATLAAAAARASRFRFERAVMRVATFRAALALAAGDVTAARAWRQGLGARFEGEPRFEDHQEQVTLVRLSLAEGDVPAARDRARRCAAFVARRGLLGQHLELLVLGARSDLQDGDAAGARRVLERALDLAAPPRFVRPFLQDGDVLVPLLRTLADRGGSRYAGHLLRVWHANGSAATSASPRSGEPLASDDPNATEPLTEREATVLRLLVAGGSNKAIARELDVSVNTVKTHVRTIYAKLGVSSRAQLAAKVRAVGR